LAIVKILNLRDAARLSRAAAARRRAKPVSRPEDFRRDEIAFGCGQIAFGCVEIQIRRGSIALGRGEIPFGRGETPRGCGKIDSSRR
jgi:hypothetical protein